MHGRGLAVRPGDADAAEMARRITGQARRDRSEHSPDIDDTRLGDVKSERALDEECASAPRHRVGGVVVTVGTRAGKTRKARARHDPAAVMHERGDLDVVVARPLDDVEAAQQLGQSHPWSYSFLGGVDATVSVPGVDSSSGTGGAGGAWRTMVPCTGPLGGTRSWRRANCMIRANVGAATSPP